MATSRKRNQSVRPTNTVVQPQALTAAVLLLIDWLSDATNQRNDDKKDEATKSKNGINDKG